MPEPIRRHRRGCAYGARRPSGLVRHSIEAMEVAAFDTAGSPPPACALIYIDSHAPTCIRCKSNF